MVAILLLYLSSNGVLNVTNELATEKLAIEGQFIQFLGIC